MDGSEKANYSQIPTGDSAGTLEKGRVDVSCGRRETRMALQVNAYTATTWMLVIWRACNGMMSLFFGLATFVQINDPDAALWMFGYGVPSILCALIGLKPHVTEILAWRRVADLHMMLCTGMLLIIGWKLNGQNTTGVFQEEEAREFGGVVLTVLWLMLCRHSGRSAVGKLRVSAAVLVTLFPFACWFYFHIHEELRANWPAHCKTAL
ncbi:transmembrane protein 220 isoform X1 [Syngnathus acus]|uniref:transmembrane protein 220 isoform X1 n=1 Tax=Syngnathus acus TaxID=161584 RepID=UPI00188631A1|nr:transmembrane protein 220 isoform X1 [Syngnathus acus]